MRFATMAQFLFCFLVGTFLFTTTAHAKRNLKISVDEVAVYSGPGKMFRPLTKLQKGTEVTYSPKTVTSKGVEFYKVAIPRNGKNVIGYIAVDDLEPELEDDGEDEASTTEEAAKAENEIDRLDEFPLSRHAIQISYSHFKTERALASIGYMRFIAPSLYGKFQAGAFKSEVATSPLVSFELGSDSAISKHWSAYILGSAGVFINPKVDALFEGSKKDFSNFIFQAGLGFRYSFSNLAAISLGGTQAALYSANNSSLTFGGLLTLEWPL